MREADAHNEAWRQWFADARIEPFELAYEALDEDPDRSARSVLAFLGLEAPDGKIEAPNVRMADSLSTEWISRYKEAALER